MVTIQMTQSPCHLPDRYLLPPQTQVHHPLTQVPHLQTPVHQVHHGSLSLLSDERSLFPSFVVLWPPLPYMDETYSKVLHHYWQMATLLPQIRSVSLVSFWSVVEVASCPACAKSFSPICPFSLTV